MDDEMTKEDWFEVFRGVNPDLTVEEFDQEWENFIKPRLDWNKRLSDRG